MTDDPKPYVLATATDLDTGAVTEILTGIDPAIRAHAVGALNDAVRECASMTALVDRLYAIGQTHQAEGPLLAWGERFGRAIAAAMLCGQAVSIAIPDHPEGKTNGRALGRLAERLLGEP